MPPAAAVPLVQPGGDLLPPARPHAGAGQPRVEERVVGIRVDERLELPPLQGGEQEHSDAHRHPAPITARAGNITPPSLVRCASRRTSRAARTLRRMASG